MYGMVFTMMVSVRAELRLGGPPLREFRGTACDVLLHSKCVFDEERIFFVVEDGREREITFRELKAAAAAA